MRLGLVLGNAATSALTSYRAAEEERRTRETEKRRRRTMDAAAAVQAGQEHGGEAVFDDVHGAAADAGIDTDGLSPEDIATNLRNFRTVTPPDENAVNATRRIPEATFGMEPQLQTTAARTAALPTAKQVTPVNPRMAASVTPAAAATPAPAAPAATAIPASPPPAPAPAFTMDDYLDRTSMLESGGGRNTVNPNNSRVRGPFQFDRATFTRIMPGGNIDDPQDQRRAAALLAMDNARQLASRGAVADPPNLYLAHVQGAAGASALLTAPAGANAVDVLTPVAGSRDLAMRRISLNGGNANTTAGQYVSTIRSRFMGVSGTATGPLPAVSTEPSENTRALQELAAGMGSTDTTIVRPIEGAAPITAGDHRRTQLADPDTPNPDIRYGSYTDATGRERWARNPHRLTEDEAQTQRAAIMMASEDPELMALGSQLATATVQRRLASLEARRAEITTEAAEFGNAVVRAARHNSVPELLAAWGHITDGTNISATPIGVNSNGETVYRVVQSDQFTGTPVDAGTSMTQAQMFAYAASLTNPETLLGFHQQSIVNTSNHIDQVLRARVATADSARADAATAIAGGQLNLGWANSSRQASQFERQLNLASAPNVQDAVYRAGPDGNQVLVAPESETDPLTGRRVYFSPTLGRNIRFPSAHDAMVFANPRAVAAVEPVALADGSVGYRVRALGNLSPVYHDLDPALTAARTGVTGSTGSPARPRARPTSAPASAAASPARAPAAAPASRSAIPPRPTLPPRPSSTASGAEMLRYQAALAAQRAWDAERQYDHVRSR